jgi:endoglycosylceramidase
MKRFIPVLLALWVITACLPEGIPPDTGQPAQSILDQYGRTLILHGLNTSSSAKTHPERMPWIEEFDVEREATLFGFNFVRFLIFWDAIEPEQGIYDESYLDKVEERISWYASRGMYVMLDMHQDIYSIHLGGDGAPLWAIEPNGHPLEFSIDGPWWLQNLSPAAIAAWVNFWSYSEHTYLQEHYTAMWQHVAERFRDNPYVIGYDLMNEPWGGDLVKTVITGDFERYQLAAFYERIIPAIRAVDPDKYIMFEPAPAPVTYGQPSRLPAISDSRAESRIVYAPHQYAFDTHEGLGYTGGAKSQVRDWERCRRGEVRKHGNVPLVCGEFGLSPQQPGFDEYLVDILDVFDRNNWHWAYWSNDLGGWSPLDPEREETAILPYLVRTYPRATSGILHNFHFDWDTKEFSMEMTTTATGMPTEIFVPDRHYPNGWQLSVEGSDNWSQEWAAERQVLSVSVPTEGQRLEITIRPN